MIAPVADENAVHIGFDLIEWQWQRKPNLVLAEKLVPTVSSLTVWDREIK